MVELDKLQWPVACAAVLFEAGYCDGLTNEKTRDCSAGRRFKIQESTSYPRVPGVLFPRAVETYTTTTFRYQGPKKGRICLSYLSLSLPDITQPLPSQILHAVVISGRILDYRVPNLPVARRFLKTLHTIGLCSALTSSFRGV